MIAVSTKERSSFVPSVPTVNESGLPRYESGVWMGIFAPQGTPPQIIDKLSDALKRILDTADIKKLIAAQGLQPMGLKAGDFGARLSADIDSFSALIREQKLETE